MRSVADGKSVPANAGAFVPVATTDKGVGGKAPASAASAAKPGREAGPVDQVALLH
jgi:hypothetical protein